MDWILVIYENQYVEDVLAVSLQLFVSYELPNNSSINDEGIRCVIEVVKEPFRYGITRSCMVQAVKRCSERSN